MNSFKIMKSKERITPIMWCIMIASVGVIIFAAWTLIDFFSKL